MSKIGFSLGMCIKDIIEGRVTEMPVAIILERESTSAKALKERCRLYWGADPELAMDIVNKLLSEGRIIHRSDIWHDIPNS